MTSKARIKEMMSQSEEQADEERAYHTHWSYPVDARCASHLQLRGGIELNMTLEMKKRTLR